MSEYGSLVTPGWSRSTTNALMPRPRPSSLVRAKTTAPCGIAAAGTCDLAPVSTQSLAVADSARSRGLPASEPACGSDSPIPTMPSPLVICGTHCAATSGRALPARICPTSEPTTCR